MLKTVFMGTPGFAARILETLLDSGLTEVVAVYSQPDRPAGRGKSLKSPEVKLLAEKRGIPVMQPPNFRSAEDVRTLAAFAPDLLVVAAYGLILPQRVLDIPRIMPVNVHASILPQYRGAAPIQRAIMNGDAYTGNTIMRMEAGMDTGPILLQSLVPILDDDTSESLHDKLAANGGHLLARAFELLDEGQLVSQAQDESKATMAPKLTKEEGSLHFDLACNDLHNRIRGLTSWPGANFTLHRSENGTLTVTGLPGQPYPAEQSKPLLAERFARHGLQYAPGRVQGLVNEQLLVACADGWYGFKWLKPSGGKLLDAQSFYNGYIKGRDVFFSSGSP